MLPPYEAGDTHRAAGPRSWLRAQLRECGGPAEACCGVSFPDKPWATGAARWPPFLEGKSEGSDCNFKDSARLPLLAMPAGPSLPFPASGAVAEPGVTSGLRAGPLTVTGMGCFLCGGFTEAGSRPSETAKTFLGGCPDFAGGGFHGGNFQILK